MKRFLPLIILVVVKLIVLLLPFQSNYVYEGTPEIEVHYQHPMVWVDMVLSAMLIGPVLFVKTKNDRLGVKIVLSLLTPLLVFSWLWIYGMSTIGGPYVRQPEIGFYVLFISYLLSVLYAFYLAFQRRTDIPAFRFTSDKLFILSTVAVLLLCSQLIVFQGRAEDFEQLMTFKGYEVGSYYHLLIPVLFVAVFLFFRERIENTLFLVSYFSAIALSIFLLAGYQSHDYYFYKNETALMIGGYLQLITSAILIVFGLYFPVLKPIKQK